MKKEVLLAISIGFALGLVITFGIWTANKSLAGLKSKNPESPTPMQTVLASPAAKPTTAPTTGLTITSPEDETFTNKNSITISGKATPSARVVILYEGDYDILLADASGNFTDDIALIAGFNSITVSAFDAAGAESTQELVITYSTAKI